MVKNSPANAGDVGLIPGSGRSLGGEHGNVLQYSCLENPVDRGAYCAIVIGSQRVRQDWANESNNKAELVVKTLPAMQEAKETWV